MKQTESITKTDIERLVDAYFDCLLTKAEEADLRRVLAYTGHTSPAIEAARAAIGAEVAVRRMPARRAGRRRLSWTAVAASVAVLAAAAVFAILAPSGGQRQIVVYSQGKEVTDREAALQMARAEISGSRELMCEMLEVEQTQLQAAMDIEEARNVRNSIIYNLQ